ncbi:MAG: hypothetical protein ABIQ30_18375 [Devosia sp.]
MESMVGGHLGISRGVGNRGRSLHLLVMTSQPLRDDLEKFARRPPAEFEAAFSELSSVHQHSLVLRSVEGRWNYNCLAYALNVHLTEDFYAVSMRSPRSYSPTGADLVSALLLARMEEKQSSEAKEGDLLLYYDGDDWRHAGKIVSAKRAISKWGTGPQMEHELLQVPSSYGSDLRFFVQPDRELVLDLMVDVVNAHLASLEPLG